MGGQDQPFIYDPPTGRESVTYPYSDFNPRAATQAHYAAFAERAERSKLRSQQEGKPLINFNAHPDSYMIVPTPNVDHKPMSASAKKNIIWARWAQLALRIVQEIGALGILVCVICLKMKSDAPGYMIRVAPAWDSLITMYAIYHLIRPAKGRTPGSSASYHFFALFTDTSLIPLYVLISLYANQNWAPQEGDDNRWTSFFKTDFATTTVIHVTFYASIAAGALHLISIGLDLYLILMFRKIARLPPDMNPLENNLTGSTRRSRSSMKHKHKNSEMTVSSLSSEDFNEKKMGYLSGSTLSLDDSYLSKVKGPEARVVPFGHSRVESDNNYSPQHPNSRWNPQQQYEQVNFYQGPRSARSSRQDVAPGHRSRAGSVVDDKHASAVHYDEVSSMPTYANDQHHYRQHQSSPDRHAIAPLKSAMKSQQKQGLLNDNWYVTNEEPLDLGVSRGNVQYQVEPTLPRVDLERRDSFQPQALKPLNMNPPSPPPHDEYPDPDEQHPEHYNGSQHSQYEPIETGVARTLTVASHATMASSVYSESAPSLASGRPMNAAPRGRHYGDLAAATRGVRGAVGLGAANPAINRPLPGTTQYGVITHASSRTPSPKKNGGRVISRSGVDIADANLYAQERGYGMSRREVSGKVAEEGRSQW